MVNPARLLIQEVVHRTPQTVLLVGTVLSLLDFLFLLLASQREGVLSISGGVGLWQNHGLLSMIVGNCFLPYLARRYHDAVCAVRTSKAVLRVSPVDRELAALTSMMRLSGRYAVLLYVLIFIGSLFWMANVGVHLSGNVQRWAARVFDSTDHPLSFLASRLHNLYSWMIVLPACGYIIIFTSIQLRQIILRAAGSNALRYDLLNPDRYGGFRFAERAQVLFNVALATAYVETTLHVQTFERMNAEHVVAYVVMTLLLTLGNHVFLFDIRAIIASLREAALNETKEKVYRDDKLSFYILKYCYDQRLNEFSAINVITKLCAILIPLGTKLAPTVVKLFT